MCGVDGIIMLQYFKRRTAKVVVQSVWRLTLWREIDWSHVWTNCSAVCYRDLFPVMRIPVLYYPLYRAQGLFYFAEDVAAPVYPDTNTEQHVQKSVAHNSRTVIFWSGRRNMSDNSVR